MQKVTHWMLNVVDEQKHYQQIL